FTRITQSVSCDTSCNSPPRGRASVSTIFHGFMRADYRLGGRRWLPGSIDQGSSLGSRSADPRERHLAGPSRPAGSKGYSQTGYWTAPLTTAGAPAPAKLASNARPALHSSSGVAFTTAPTESAALKRKPL